MKELYELKEKLCDELKEYGKKDMSTGSLDVVDKLAHAVKNIDKIIDAYDSGLSGYYAYNDGDMSGRLSDRSYTRSNTRRDSMGRYSRHSLSEKIRELMEDAPDERSRMEIRRLAEKMESM